MDSESLDRDIEFQIEHQGAAAYKTKDGEVFVFSTKVLEKLLENSRGTGFAQIFIKTRETA